MGSRVASRSAGSIGGKLASRIVSIEEPIDCQKGRKTNGRRFGTPTAASGTGCRSVPSIHASSRIPRSIQHGGSTSATGSRSTHRAIRQQTWGCGLIAKKSSTAMTSRGRTRPRIVPIVCGSAAMSASATSSLRALSFAKTTRCES